MTNIGIVGSRDFPDLGLVVEYVHSLPKDTVVVSGNAKGVDKTAETVAMDLGMEVISLPADWKQHGKSAGYKRNGEIVARSHKIVAFWDGKSKGTKHTIDIAYERGIPVDIYVRHL